MDAHGAGQLGNAGNGQLDVLAGGHDKVAELVDDHHDVGHVLMSFLRIELAVDELLVILLDIAHVGQLQEVVARVHLHADRIEGLHHLGDIRNDGLSVAGKLGQEMMLNDGIDAELHLLGVHQHEFQFRRMLLI